MPRQSEWKVRHIISNAAGHSNLQRKKVWADRFGVEHGCTEPRNKANTRMLNKMQAFAEEFYYGVYNYGRPMLGPREHKLVDLITKNHFQELDEGYYKRIGVGSKKVEGRWVPWFELEMPEFTNWFKQEFPSIREEKFFDALREVGPEKACTYLKAAIDECLCHERFHLGWFQHEDCYTRGTKNEHGMVMPAPKEQLIKEIEKFTQQEELK